jgi:RimJ/RimL family protein N-acetyltransferase
MKTLELQTQKSFEPEIIRTKIEDVVARDLTVDDLGNLKEMFEQNETFFAQGGMFTDSLYKMIEKEINSDAPNINRRLGVWESDKLIGIVSVNPFEHGEPNEVEISGGGAKEFARRGIAFAVAEAIIDDENDRGNDVVAEVEPYNIASKRLLGKLGFELTNRQTPDERDLYIHEAWDEDKLRRKFGF